VSGSLPLFVAVPLAAAFALPIAARKAQWIGHLLSLGATAALLVLSLWILGGPPVVCWVGGWVKPVGISMVADGLSRLVLVIINAVAFTAVLFSAGYMRRFSAPHLYYCLFMLMVAGMNGLVLAGDLFNLFVFLEIAAIASYALVAFGVEREELEAALKYLVLGTIASAFILVGIGILYNLTGQLNMALVAERLEPIRTSAPVLLAAGFFLMGFGLKAAMVPFHAWLPDAHPSAPAPISAMLSGVLIKAAGVYAICRLAFNVLGVQPLYGNVLIVMGALSMLIGVMLAVGQWDFKRLLAYHSISQMGYVILAVGVGAAVLARGGAPAVAGLAIFGGLFHLFNHAFFKSLLFLCSGSIEFTTGTRQLGEMGGLRGSLPVTSGCCRTAALSIAGVPPFNGFWSKLIIIVAVARAGYWAMAALAAFVSFMTLVSFVKVQKYALEGPTGQRVAAAREVPAGMRAAMLALAAACLLAGVLVPLYGDVLLKPATTVLTQGLACMRQLVPVTG